MPNPDNHPQADANARSPIARLHHLALGPAHLYPAGTTPSRCFCATARARLSTNAAAQGRGRKDDGGDGGAGPTFGQARLRGGGNWASSEEGERPRARLHNWPLTPRREISTSPKPPFVLSPGVVCSEAAGASGMHRDVKTIRRRLSDYFREGRVRVNADDGSDEEPEARSRGGGNASVKEKRRVRFDPDAVLLPESGSNPPFESSETPSLRSWTSVSMPEDGSEERGTAGADHDSCTGPSENDNDGPNRFPFAALPSAMSVRVPGFIRSAFSASPSEGRASQDPDYVPPMWSGIFAVSPKELARQQKKYEERKYREYGGPYMVSDSQGRIREVSCPREREGLRSLWFPGEIKGETGEEDVQWVSMRGGGSWPSRREQSSSTRTSNATNTPETSRTSSPLAPPGATSEPLHTTIVPASAYPIPIPQLLRDFLNVYSELTQILPRRPWRECFAQISPRELAIAQRVFEERNFGVYRGPYWLHDREGHVREVASQGQREGLMRQWFGNGASDSKDEWGVADGEGDNTYGSQGNDVWVDLNGVPAWLYKQWWGASKSDEEVPRKGGEADQQQQHLGERWDSGEETCCDQEEPDRPCGTPAGDEADRRREDCLVEFYRQYLALAQPWNTYCILDWYPPEMMSDQLWRRITSVIDDVERTRNQRAMTSGAQNIEKRQTTSTRGVKKKCRRAILKGWKHPGSRTPSQRSGKTSYQLRPIHGHEAAAICREEIGEVGESVDNDGELPSIGQLWAEYVGPGQGIPDGALNSRAWSDILTGFGRYRQARLAKKSE